MCNKTPKRETEVLADPFDPLNLPQGRDWVNDEPTFSYGPPDSNGTRELLLPPEPLSAPPRASRWQQVGLVARTLGKRLCDRHVASCAILAAALVFLALTGVFSLFGG